MAWVVGDGETFGKGVAVDDDNVADIVRWFGPRASDDPGTG